MTTSTPSISSQQQAASQSLDALLEDLPLRPSTHALLKERGFTGTCRELLQVVQSGGMAHFAAELNLSSPAVAARIHREIQQALERTRASSMTAAEILSQQRPSSNNMGNQRPLQSSIITFSRSVDVLLNGGIRVGELTEIAGAPGAGKTQLAMQLAINAKLPTEFGGVAGDTLYIDTEGSFAPSRCWDMATALVRHIHFGRERRKKRKQQVDERTVPEWFTPESILQGVHVYRVHDVAAQSAVLFHLEERIKQHNQLVQQGQARPIRLIAIDSMAFHYRADDRNTTDFVGRTRQLTSLATRLSSIAEQYNVAVVALNQMTTKHVANTSNLHTVRQEANGFQDHHQQLVPALGAAWAHAVTTRILLVKNPPSHQGTSSNTPIHACRLTKSPCHPSGSATFQICKDGIRGLDFVVPKQQHALQYTSNNPAPNQQHHHPQQTWNPSLLAQTENTHSENKRLRGM